MFLKKKADLLLRFVCSSVRLHGHRSIESGEGVEVERKIYEETRRTRGTSKLTVKLDVWT